MALGLVDGDNVVAGALVLVLVDLRVKEAITEVKETHATLLLLLVISNKK